MRSITREGYIKIQKEIEYLWHEERPYMVNQVADAAALGDRSENAEYIYGKKRLRQIDSRLRYLKRKIAEVTVVDLEKQVPSDHIRFGAVVTVEDEDGEEKTWRLVDKEESDPKAGRISVQSPIGRALLGREEGDSVEVRGPERLIELEVLGVRYGGGPP